MLASLNEQLLTYMWFTQKLTAVLSAKVCWITASIALSTRSLLRSHRMSVESNNECDMFCLLRYSFAGEQYVHKSGVMLIHLRSRHTAQHKEDERVGSYC